MARAKKLVSPALHIPREHQSAPAEHWADKEVAKAAEEIRTGQFTPVLEEDDFLAVGLQRGAAVSDPAKLGGAEKLALIDQTLDSMALAQHPRVKAALARLETEKREARSSQELAEKAQMLFELNARSAQANQWDGQGRWMGRENEEMRIINILTPFQFLQRLEKVIGAGRVYLNRYAVSKRVALLAPDNGEKRIILLPSEKRTDDQGLVQVGTLQYPCGPEWMVPRFDEYGVPTTAKYLGWRTALLSMIDLRVISEKEAHKTFPLASGPASTWYRQQLYEIRGRYGVMN
jgi:hypothetical protein